MLFDLIRFWWTKSSSYAACVCIGLASRMTDKDLRDMADYFKATIENRLAEAERAN